MMFVQQILATPGIASILPFPATTATPVRWTLVIPFKDAPIHRFPTVAEMEFARRGSRTRAAAPKIASLGLSTSKRTFAPRATLGRD